MREQARETTRDPLLTEALARVVPSLERMRGERGAAMARLCREALNGSPRPVPAGGASAVPPVPERWTRLCELLDGDRATMLGLAERIAETTALGTVVPAPAVREVWELAVSVLLAVAARTADLSALAPLVRAGVFLRTPVPAGGPCRSSFAALTRRAAWFLAARQRPDGGFGDPALTLECAWTLAEVAVPGLTAARRGLLPATAYGEPANGHEPPTPHPLHTAGRSDADE